jgi:hypothetical protein
VGRSRNLRALEVVLADLRVVAADGPASRGVGESRQTKNATRSRYTTRLFGIRRQDAFHEDY